MPVPRAPSQPGTFIDVLFISRSETDSAALARMLKGTHWNLLRVRTCGEALATLDTVLVPVVICDMDVECDWKHIVDLVIHAPHPAPVLVAGADPDWHLWEEVIDRGGFDLLRKPMKRAKVAEMLDSALRHWETGRVRRTWDRMEMRAKSTGA